MNFEKYVNSRLFTFFNFLYKMVILSLIFFVASVLGLIFLTIVVTGIGILTIIKSTNDNNELPLILSFGLIFKKYFLKGLFLSLIVLGITFLLAFNTYYFYELTIKNQSIYSYIALYLTIGLDIIAISCLVMTMLISVYFPFLKTYNTLKYSLMMLFAFPGAFFMLVGLIIVFFILAFLFPYIIPIILPGLFFYFVYLIYHYRLEKLVTKDGILPLDAFEFLSDFRQSKKIKTKSSK